jgi:ABC-type multidrug transport system ATPase subunit
MRFGDRSLTYVCKIFASHYVFFSYFAEPTSGLDATSALDLMDCLKRVAARGVTVVAVLHQPRVEVFEKVDHLLLLARGRCAGLRRSSIRMCELHSPAGKGVSAAVKRQKSGGFRD